jgi:hypothetical protein
MKDEILPLARFAPFRDLDAAFYSLENGAQAVLELKELLSSGWSGPTVMDWTDELHDFSDTAALIENLDLVISVDTSTPTLQEQWQSQFGFWNRFDIE